MGSRTWRGAPVAGQTVQAGALHQQLHGAVADMDAQAQTELGVHGADAVHGAGGGVDAPDGLGQQGVLTRRFDGGRSRQA